LISKVALIEEHLLGGDCLNVGCVPSKSIIHSAKLAHTVRGFNPRQIMFFAAVILATTISTELVIYPLVVGDVAKLEEAGISVDPRAVKVDFEKVMERVRRIRAAISHHDSAERFTKELGVHVYIGRGKFSGPKSIVVNGQTLTFKRAVIATGTCTFALIENTFH
jgi:pyruvate/2-oxoglutarate dehydrogenase complex dihydrolipoamide dehydrogenase (E3) component